jgi:hypothetical protein
MSVPWKPEHAWALELARGVSALPGHEFLAFLSELSKMLTERSEEGPQDEREIMAALAEHFGDADEAAHFSILIKRERNPSQQ